MAHGNYDCCAICDDKQSFNADALAKAEICPRCVVALARQGIFVASVAELLEWMRREATAISILDGLGFRECYYSNQVDELYRKLGGAKGAR